MSMCMCVCLYMLYIKMFMCLQLYKLVNIHTYKSTIKHNYYVEREKYAPFYCIKLNPPNEMNHKAFTKLKFNENLLILKQLL